MSSVTLELGEIAICPYCELKHVSDAIAHSEGDRLKELEEEGYIKSEIYDHARKWRKYALTDRGKRMAEKILKIMEIIET